MKRLSVIGACVLGLCVGQAAYAAITDISQLTDMDVDVVTQWEDSDWEILVKGTDNQAASLEEGDFLVGFWQVQKASADQDGDGLKTPGVFDVIATPSPAAGDLGITAFFAVKIATIEGDDETNTVPFYGGVYDYGFEFEAPTDADWTTIGTNFMDGGSTVVPSRVDSDTSLIVFQDLDGRDAQGDYAYWKAGDQAGSIKTATHDESGTANSMVYEFGFEEDNAFWLAGSDSLSIAGLTDPHTVFYRAGLDLTAQGTGPGLLEHDWHDFDSEAGIDGPWALELVGDNEAAYNATEGFLPTDTDLYINAAPEPSAILVWSVMFGLGLLGLRKRTRK